MSEPGAGPWGAGPRALPPPTECGSEADGSRLKSFSAAASCVTPGDCLTLFGLCSLFARVTALLGKVPTAFRGVKVGTAPDADPGVQQTPAPILQMGGRGPEDTPHHRASGFKGGPVWPSLRLGAERSPPGQFPEAGSLAGVPTLPLFCLGPSRGERPWPCLCGEGGRTGPYVGCCSLSCP